MFGAYQRWCQTTSTRAQFFEGLLDMCGLVDDPDCPKAGKHRELERAEVKKSEEAVQRTITAITSFSNPFALPDKDHLYSLASGAQGSSEVEKDVLGADKIGRNAKAAFITERFVYGGSKESFFEPIKRMKLKTMESSNKTVKLTASQGKIVQYQEQSNIAFTLLVKSQQLREPIQLEEVNCDEIPELSSNQEETDTRVVIYLKYAATQGYKSAVVRTPDTDLILLHHAPSIDLDIYIDLGTGKNRELINVSELADTKGNLVMTGLYTLQ
ncbi:uncharacterized protein LOC128239473 isoform X2 [Mya arenaria]|uniref:uncharacterized protein LOC128239473 isoform X2 n=1 Tax=Mya arenaria TaxID=6604 RepID=UPI0022DF083C|nr:uncharacterized protein LOC128239473 isoform X2 [Mya arenaria]